MNNIGFNNKAWGRSTPSSNMINQNPIQPLINQSAALGNIGTGMLQFQQPQPQVFQNAMGLQQQNLGLGLQQMANSAAINASLGPQMGSNSLFQQVTYPNARGLNPTAFQTNVQTVQNSATGAKQRVFTGKVTQIHDNFGLVDEEVIFQMNACVKGSNPVVGDRVLVEASYTPNMHFKWSATRIQVLSMKNQNSRHSNSSNDFIGSSGYNAVPPPSEGPNFNRNENASFNRNDNTNFARPENSNLRRDDNSNFGRAPRQKAVGRGRERSREKEKEDDVIERKRRREERHREREKEEKKSPVRRRSRSPKARRRSMVVPRYMVQIPKIALDIPQADVLELRRRYSNLYVPYDFFFTRIKWVDSFPADKPFAMNKPCAFHIMSKKVEPVTENDAVLELPDADYSFSAKVMLMSVPGMDELYHKCCGLAEEKEKRDRDSEEYDYIHPTRLINFLVGLRGKNETMAIGGPWSPSLDGPNPDKDPMVLIKTAIRTCKALTGIDLSSCTQWYRFVELYYRRSDHKGEARVQTVVLFLPDVWSCLPTRLEWDNLQMTYRKKWKAISSESVEAASTPEKDSSTKDVASAVSTESTSTSTKSDEKEGSPEKKQEPTHFSKLDPKIMSVNDLRTELKARGISHRGLKSQMVARLAKALKSEAESEENKSDEPEAEKQGSGEESEQEDVKEEKHEEKKTEGEKKKLDDREKAVLEKRYTLPDKQHIIVHPSKTAKSGKFDCAVMSLSVLLDYGPEDTKEHSFEVSLFAELFNEMLIRDFGFNIYKALYLLPEKPKEEKETSEKKENDDKKEKDEKKDDKKKEDDKKVDDKKKDEKKEADKKKRENSRDRSRDSKEKSESRDDDKKRSSRRDDREVSDDSDDDRDDRDKRRDKDKRKERVKLVTKEKDLLLSFVYFDQSHCGYIFNKDLVELLYTLGIRLSRAQVKRLVNKVASRNSLHYRKLTDKPKDEEAPALVMDSNLPELASGNKALLPVFKDEHCTPEDTFEGAAQNQLSDGFVMYRGSLVDVGKLMAQLERSEKARTDTEAKMVELKNDNQKLQDKYNKSNSTIKHLSTEVKEYKEKIRSTEDTLSQTSMNSQTFYTTLVEIRDKIEPVLKNVGKKEKEEKSHKDEKSGSHEDTKSRWEKGHEAKDDKDYGIKKEPTSDVEMSEEK